MLCEHNTQMVIKTQKIFTREARLAEALLLYE